MLRLSYQDALNDPTASIGKDGKTLSKIFLAINTRLEHGLSRKMFMDLASQPQHLVIFTSIDTLLHLGWYIVSFPG